MDVNKALDQAELIVEIKSLEKNIVNKIDELEATGKQLKGEMETLGAANTETLAKADALNKQYSELYDRVQAVEQKSAASLDSGAGGYNIGAEFVKSEAFQGVVSGRQPSGRMEVKTAIINAVGQNQPLVAADRLSGINTVPSRQLRIRDLLASTPTTSNLIEFTRENAFTNNAGPTVSGSPQAFENVTKPESAITFTLINVPVVTLAHWIPASRQVLEDSDSLASHINGRLMYGLKLKEETQMVTGTGVNHQLNGLYTQATAYTVASPTRTNPMDILRDAIKQAQVAEYMPDFVVLNPVDWFNIEIYKVSTTDKRYVFGDPNTMHGPNIWGCNVVVTNSIAAGTFLIGSSAAAEIKDRQQAAIEMSREDGSNFVKNMVTVLAEERIALLCYRTECFIKGSI